MIEQLSVKNYVLFDGQTVDFDDRMTAITGETGAGKSLLIDAISLLRGERLSGNVVRAGADKAILQMVLSDPSKEVLDLLEENGYEADDEIIITRIIMPNGKSRIQINQQASTNAFVKQITSSFIDIHSQMDTHRLIDPAVQLDLLDRFIDSDSLKSELAQAYQNLSGLQNELSVLQNETFSDDELDFLTQQLNEIDEANLSDGELEALQEEIKVASHFHRNLEDLESVLYLFKKENGLLDNLDQIRSVFKRNPLFDQDYDAFLERYHELVDLSDHLEEQKEEITAQAENLDALQSREYQLQRIYKKYGGSYPAILESRKRIEERIERILHRQDVFDRLQQQIEQAQKEYDLLAKQLSEKRAEVIPQLEEQIIAQAKDLMLENIRFKISQKPKKPSSTGIDEIEFYASMNPGVELSTLKQAGSGGELSRLMLALKTVFQAQKGITTLIFDEIDTGVSGKVAYAMGSKMSSLAKNYQVFSITHLPAVAAWSDHHFRVSKQASENSSSTVVEALEDDRHLEELAIMSAGTTDRETIDSMRLLDQRIAAQKAQ